MSEVMTADPFGIRLADVDLNTRATMHFLPTGFTDLVFVEKPPTGGWDPGVVLNARRVNDGKLVRVHFNDDGVADRLDELPES